MSLQTPTLILMWCLEAAFLIKLKIVIICLTFHNKRFEFEVEIIILPINIKYLTTIDFSVIKTG